MKVGNLSKGTVSALMLAAAMGMSAHAQEAPSAPTEATVSVAEVGQSAKKMGQQACGNETVKTIAKGLIGFLGAGPLAGKAVDSACEVAQKPAPQEAAAAEGKVASPVLVEPGASAPLVGNVGENVKQGVADIGKSLGGFLGRLKERRVATTEEPSTTPTPASPGM